LLFNIDISFLEIRDDLFKRNYQSNLNQQKCSNPKKPDSKLS